MILANCDAVRDALPDALAGSLGPEQSRALAEHLAACADCRTEVEVVRVLRQHPVRVPDGLEARVRRAVAARRGPGRFHLSRPALLAAAAAGVLLGGALLLRPRPGEQAPRVSTAPPPVRASAAAIPPVDGRGLMQTLPGTTDAGLFSSTATLDDLSDEELRTLLKELQS